MIEDEFLDCCGTVGIGGFSKNSKEDFLEKLSNVQLNLNDTIKDNPVLKGTSLLVMCVLTEKQLETKIDRDETWRDLLKKEKFVKKNTWKNLNSTNRLTLFTKQIKKKKQKKNDELQKLRNSEEIRMLRYR